MPRSTSSAPSSTGPGASLRRCATGSTSPAPVSSCSTATRRSCPAWRSSPPPGTPRATSPCSSTATASPLTCSSATRPTPPGCTPTRTCRPTASSCPARPATSPSGRIRCAGSSPWTRTGCTSATTPTSSTADEGLTDRRDLLDAKPRQLVGPFVALVPLDPQPADLVPVHGPHQPAPQVIVLDRLLGRGLPAVALPARDPLGDPVQQVLAVSMQPHLRRPV